MNILRVFIKLVRKNIFSIALYLAIAVFMISMRAVFTNNNNVEEVFERETYTIAIIDKDKSEVSSELISYLEKIHTVENMGSDVDKLNMALYYEGISAHVIIPDGFGESFYSDSPMEITTTIDEGMPVGTFITNDINSYLKSLKSYTDLGYSLSESSEFAYEILKDTDDVHIRSAEEVENNSFNDKLMAVYEGMPYGIICIILCGMLPVLSTLRRKLISDRTEVSACSNLKYNLMIVLGTILFAAVSSIIVIVTATITSDYSGDFRTWLLLSLNIVANTIAITLMLPLLSTFTNSASSRNIMINVISLGFSFLGGVFVPISLMSRSTKAIGSFLPSYWNVVAVSRIVNNESLLSIFSCFGLQLLFGLACLSIGLILSDAKMKKVL